MVVPPRHVYSAIFKNTSAHDVQVIVTFTMPGDNAAPETVTLDIKAGAEGTVAEKTVDIGTATHIGHISEVTVKGNNTEQTVTGPFNVNSPVRNHIFTIGADLAITN